MLCILSPGQAEQTINKSRFVAVAESCSNERELALCMRRMASAHQGAHHLAYAFRIKTAEGIVQRFSDAGEPSGTAGKPIMQFIEGRDLINVCVAVVRYYGGINLGTGGLSRAYGGTGKMALDAAKIGPYVEMQQIKLVIEYKLLDQLTRDLERINGQLQDKMFGEKVTVLLNLPKDKVAEIRSKYS